MLGLIRKIYRAGLEITAWLILLAGFIVGGILMAGYRQDFSMKGAIIGLIIGFIIDVFYIGMLATFIELSNDVKNIKAKLYNENSPVDSPSRASLLCPSCNARIRHERLSHSQKAKNIKKML